MRAMEVLIIHEQGYNLLLIDLKRVVDVLELCIQSWMLVSTQSSK